jgi:uncharacterized protein YeaO (DUF488 family)
VNVRIKRIYEAPSEEDGKRVLVDRLWPRDPTKERARVDLRLKEIAPTTELRKWFARNSAWWPEFQKRSRRVERERRAGFDFKAGSDAWHSYASLWRKGRGAPRGGDSPIHPQSLIRTPSMATSARLTIFRLPGDSLKKQASLDVNSKARNGVS